MTETAGTATDQGFSLFGLILHADPVVQAVVVGLVLASVVCWAIIFEKMVRLFRLRRDVQELETAATNGGFTGQEQSATARAVSAAVVAESTEGAAPGETQSDLRARLERAMRTKMRFELKRVEGGLPFLATTGSAAPFIGLFGTVWGIMNSFTSIARSHDTSLAVVAPGIAEALFATALGLAAAIPAVIAYNQLVVALGKRATGMGGSISLIAKKLARSGYGTTAIRSEEAA